MSAGPQTASSSNVLVHRGDEHYAVTLFDSPILEDAAFLVAELEEFMRRGLAVPVVVDVRGLRKLDSGPFLRVSEKVTRCRSELFVLLKTVAVLHTGGLAAASVSGGIAMTMGSAFNVETFTEEGPAFAWLGFSDELARQHQERVAEFRATPNLLRDCQSYIEAHLATASLDDCAESLGRAEAELQRELGVAGTSFRSELRNVRIECAKDLLVNTSEPTHRIGEQVGYRKQQNFTDAFRKATGMTPGAWRKQQRSA